MKLNLIVIATDGSDASGYALLDGFSLAETTGASVSVVHVRHTPSTALGTPYYNNAVIEASRHADDVLTDAKLFASRYGIDADYTTVGGEPADAIVDFARARDADLIVVGSRGLGTLTGAILGSVSRAVVQRADRPVLVAKARARVLESSEAA